MIDESDKGSGEGAPKTVPMPKDPQAMKQPDPQDISWQEVLNQKRGAPVGNPTKINR